MSKNLLSELPEDFGEMSQLKHLDLYSNQITHLPLSFCELRNLRWLDLKNNPLAPAVARVIGPCLDGGQCAAAARAAVQLYTEMRAKVEEERELRRQQVAKAQELQLEKERQQRKRNERRKAARQKRKENHQQQQHVTEIKLTEQKQRITVKVTKTEKAIKKKRRSFLSLFLLSLLGTLPLVFLASACGLLGSWWNDTFLQGLTTLWQQCENFLPEKAQPWAQAFASSIVRLHGSTGHLVEDLSTALSELPHTNSTLELVSQAFSAAANQSQLVFRTLSEKVMFITDEITRKFT